MHTFESNSRPFNHATDSLTIVRLTGTENPLCELRSWNGSNCGMFADYRVTVSVDSEPVLVCWNHLGTLAEYTLRTLPDDSEETTDPAAHYVPNTDGTPYTDM